MIRRALVGMVVLGGMVLAGGCETPQRRANPYMSEMGKQGDITDTPPEVQEFVRDTYPDAAVERVYEKRHRKEYRVRHFEIHMVMPEGRRKVIEYNVFRKPTANVETLEKFEVQGSGTSPAALKPGYNP